MNPLDLLMPYQRGYVEDASRWKLWLASRQVGKSFAAACEVAMDGVLHPGSHWLLVSAGQRQALELIAKVKQWIEAFDAVISWEGMEGTGADFKSAEIRLANGSRITALPANPDTVRGYSAHLVLDEFAFHRDASALWAAVLPSITNPHRGELKVRVLSTPNGRGGAGAMFYQLWSDGGSHWARHRTSIHDAVAAGLAVDIPTLRRGVADVDSWRQEYECEFIDTGRVAFPYDLIAQNESDTASMTWPSDATPRGNIYVGIDVGSLRDPTVCLTLEDITGTLTVREVLILEGMALADQDAFLSPRLYQAARVSIDASGIGIDLAQRLRRAHGGKIIEQRVTASWKRDAFQAVQNALADGGRIALPADRRFRDDLHAYEVIGAGHTATFRAPRTEEGHSDIACALVHAYDAAKAPGSGAFSAEDARATLAHTPPKTLFTPRFTPRKLR